MSQTTEHNEALLARARTGDRQAVDALIREYGSLVYGIALRQAGGDGALAADVSQAVFMVFVRRVATLRSARALPSWFLQTTRYATQEARRAAARRARHEQRAARAEQTMDPTATTTGGANDDPKLPMLDDAIAALRQGDREVVMMRYLQGRDVREIAAILGLGEEAARKRVSRAIDRMRAYFADRGVVTSADAVTGLLVTAGVATAPTAVLEACVAAATGAGSVAAAGVAKTVLHSVAGAAKLKLAATASVVVALGAGAAAVAVASGAFGPRVRQAVVTTSPTAPQWPGSKEVEVAPNSELNRLAALYALAEGQHIRVIRPPFPLERNIWVDAEFPNSGGADNVRSLGFHNAGRPRLEWRYMSYVDMNLDHLVGEVPWFRVEGLEQVKFPPLHADLVVRSDLNYQLRLEAVASVVAEFTGVRYRVTPAKVTRPCAILKGPTRRPARNTRGFTTVILTQSPLNPPATKRWLSDDHPEGTLSQGQLVGASRLVNAPFFVDGPDAADGASLGDVGLFLIAPDAQLDWRDPLYEARLRKILANLPQQIGGDWRIEQRTLDVFRIERVTGG